MYFRKFSMQISAAITKNLYIFIAWSISQIMEQKGCHSHFTSYLTHYIRKVILSTTELITVTIKVTLAATEVILACNKLVSTTEKVIFATTKVILVTKEVITAT